MSVVVWDGKRLAADKQATTSGCRMTTSKIRQLLNGEVIAWTEDAGGGALMGKWYEEGADMQKFPAGQLNNDLWARLIVASAKGVVIYERQPVPIHIQDSFAAWGSGRDYALGAMAKGANAREAVEVACRFDIGCGMGIEEYSPRADQHPGDGESNDT